LGYVLVPVPTEFVLDVMRWVLFRSADADPNAVERDAASLTAFIEATDDATRALLRRIATTTVRGETLRMRDLADELELAPQALHDTVARLNAEVLDDDRELLELRNDVTVGLNGRVGTMTFISMRPALARVVRSMANTVDD